MIPFLASLYTFGEKQKMASSQIISIFVQNAGYSIFGSYTMYLCL